MAMGEAERLVENLEKAIGEALPHERGREQVRSKPQAHPSLAIISGALTPAWTRMGSGRCAVRPMMHLWLSKREPRDSFEKLPCYPARSMA